MDLDLRIELPPLLVIVGPTATGKTELSVEVAGLVNGEIVSADSALVYKYMNIGTAKPTQQEKKGVPHYLIDIIYPDEEFSVASYKSQAEYHIADIYQRSKFPMLVGGTGLYVRSVIDHYNFSGAGIDVNFRARCQEEAKLLGNDFLHQKLAQVDPAAAAILHPNDLKRVIRALEVFEQTGCPISTFQDRDEHVKPKYQLVMYGLYMERELLYRRIEARVDRMIQQGLVDEVQKLLERGYHPGLTAMQALGYKEIVSYVLGEIGLEESISLLKRNTRRFAKRQLTWFRRDRRIRWLEITKDIDLHSVSQEIASAAAGVFKGVSNPL